MLKINAIGHIGASAEVKNANGKEFTTFRIAHTDRWKGADDVSHEETTWIDVIMQGKPSVLPYLTKGQLIYVEGSASLRVYSSPKDRCMKAGLTINARSVELLGGKSDDVPGMLYDPVDAHEYKITKHFYCEEVALAKKKDKPTMLHARSGEVFDVNEHGWVTKPVTE